MKNSLCDSLNIVYPFLDEVLANNDSLKGIDAAAGLLPGIPVVSDAGFECHLTAREANADILVAFRNRRLAESCLSTLSGLSSTSKLWQRISNFIREWSANCHSTYQNIENIWLEFDVCKESFWGQVPSLFFAPQSLEKPVKRHNDFESNTWLEEVLKLLVGHNISCGTKKCIAKCFDYLPEGGRIFQVGVMLPRSLESEAVRLCVSDIEIKDVYSYLVSIGWQDKTSELEKLLNELSTFVDRVALNISVEDTVHNKIGIECYMNKQPQFVFEQWNLLFEFLHERNLCNHKQINALLKWPGYTEEKECLTKWPQSLLQGARLAPSFRSIIARTINHIKLVYQPMMPLQAKAYLRFGHRWIDINGKVQEY
jgi:hypothetical protein